jgi:hypothetical protein
MKTSCESKMGQDKLVCTDPSGTENENPSCMPDETIIEFRPMTDWKGEFGFDWMRVYEGRPRIHKSSNGGRTRRVTSVEVDMGVKIKKFKYSAFWKFDHLREEEMPYIDGASTAATEYTHPPYEAGTNNVNRNRGFGLEGKGIVLGGYHPSSYYVEMYHKKAQEKLEREYKNFKISRTGLDYRLETYYIPWLNLFPAADAGVSAAVAGAPSQNIVTSPPPRLCDAQLQILYDVKNQPAGRIVIEFDKDFIEINENNTGRYDIPAPPLTPTHYTGSVRPMTALIRIRCIKEISDPKGSKVVVRAFGKNTKPGDTGTRAGELCVCPNTRAHHQKEIKIALVCVKTNVMRSSDPGSITGAFRDKEVEQIFHTMHQALIRPDIANLDEAGNPFVLDLSDVPEFHNRIRYAPASSRPVPPGSTPGKFIDNWNINGHKDLHRFLIKKFNEDRVKKGRHPITDRYFLFCFADDAEYAGMADGETKLVDVDLPSDHPLRGFISPRIGVVQKRRWRPSAVIVIGRPDFAAAHELLHALTLRHTHRDWEELGTPAESSPSIVYLKNSAISVGCKYLYPFETTTNIMSYNYTAAYTTWHWQWAIMQANTAIAPDDWTLGKEEKSV